MREIAATVPKLRADTFAKIGVAEASRKAGLVAFAFEPEEARYRLERLLAQA